ncbi:MAG: OmpA family protein [Spirochaetota bacterium]
MGKVRFLVVVLSVFILATCATPPRESAPEDPQKGELQGQVDGFQKSVAEKDAAILQLQGQVDSLQKTVPEKDATILQLQGQIADLQNQGTAKVPTIAKFQDGNTEVANSQDAATRSDAVPEPLQHQEKVSDERITATSARAGQVQAELDALKKRAAVKDSELGALNAKLAALGAANDELSANLASLGSGTQESQADFLARIAALSNEKSELQDRIGDLEKERDSLAILAAADEKDLDARISRLKTTFAAEIARGELDIKKVKDVLIVSVSDAVLFDPDSPKLRPTSLTILSQLAVIFKNAPEKIVRVEGNTAIAVSSADTLRLYPTSWHLGAARAANVVQYLQEQCGMDPHQLVAASLGEYRPQGDNSTESGKAQNRRVEFVLVTQDLYEIARLRSMTD